MPVCLTLGFFLVAALPSLSAVELSRDGKPAVKLYVAPAGNAALQGSARELGQYLKRITGAEFELSSEPFTGQGILLALAKDYRDLDQNDGKKLAALELEGYLLDAAAQRVLIVGNSEAAVQNGAFDLLESIGCRWLVPGERWTVVPNQPTLTAKDDHRFESPSFASRRVWYAYGTGVDASREVLGRDYSLWARANRLGGAARFQTGHSYPGTVGKHLETFKQHPEFFAMTAEGNRLSPDAYHSLCYSNPDLADIFIRDRLTQLEEAKAANPHEYMVSMDPNDGSQECYCEACKKLGNGSDQAVFLANKVARALRERYPEAKVGMYAYASHRLPPEKVKPEPNLVVEIAMGFNKTRYSYEELIQLWREQVSAIGIRDYFGVMAWDWGLPGRGKGSNLAYVTNMLPRYKEMGAVSFNTEINANWASFGPATYVATKLMWNARADAGAVYADYFEKAFGKGAAGMQELYTLWRKDQRLSQNNLHHWLQKLAEVSTTVSTEPQPVRDRVEDMMAYLHYVVLFRDWEIAEDSRDPEKAYAALKNLLAFSWRTRERQMHHSYALQRRLVNSGATVLRPLREGWRFNDPKAVWKDPSPLTTAEMQRLFQEDVAAFPADQRVVDFGQEAAVFSRVRCPREHGAASNLIFRGKGQCLVTVDSTGTYRFAIEGQDAGLYDHGTGDLIQGFTWGKKPGGAILPRAEEGDENGMGTETAARNEWIVTLKTGVIYRLVFTRSSLARTANASVAWPDGVSVAFMAPEDMPLYMDGSGPFYVFVPKGTREIICRGSPRLSLVSPNNRRIDVTPATYPTGSDAATVPVADGEDNALWTVLSMTRGGVSFLNIPPYLNSRAAQVILPKGLAIPSAQ
jgi:hypothetical protein